ncbi:MAG: DUF1800 family protein [Bacteroidota bacterium]
MQKIRHLYRRTAFAPKVSEVQAALPLTLESCVNGLLSPQPVPTALLWASDLPFPTPLTNEQQQIYNQRRRELREWWIRLMLTQAPSLTEKMTLFWHGHFATQVSDVKVPQHMVRQNALFRQYASGNFKDLVKAVAIDPAMLLYLDGHQNKVGNPNENFARELLELFTMGVDNYTQFDIQEAARAFTGWRVSGLDSSFVSSRHDFGVKTFLGHTGNFTGNDIIDIIFEQPVTARFICRKLYKFFVYEAVNEQIIDQLSVILRNNNYKISSVLEALLKSSHFFDPMFLGADISGPVERSVGAIRQLNITVDPLSTVVPKFVRTETPDMGQELLEPPNVAGWPGYRQWISTTTLLLRNAFTDAIVTGRNINNNDIGFEVDPIAFAQQFSSPNDVFQLVTDICDHLIPLPINAARKDVLVQTLLQGIDPGDWSLAYPEAGARITNLLKVVFRMAEYQLD